MALCNVRFDSEAILCASSYFLNSSSSSELIGDGRFPMMAWYWRSSSSSFYEVRRFSLNIFICWAFGVLTHLIR